MKFYLAPMEGITGHIYRRHFNELYKGVDKYFTPFIATNQTFKLKNREKREIDPKINEGMVVVPQLLTNNAQQFIWYAKEIKKLGYNEINLNVGCPSGTVVSKHKGSGMLIDLEQFDNFLETIYSELANDLFISIKTRLGIENFDDLEKLIEIYNKYPMNELIVHPRTRMDFYKNIPNYNAFKEVCEKSNKNIGYNGDIKISDDINKIITDFKDYNVDSIMIGRGFLTNPMLVENYLSNKPDTNIDCDRLKEFVAKLFEDYVRDYTACSDAINRMKELWFYILEPFSDYNEVKKYAKKIKKAKDKDVYETTVNNLIVTLKNITL
ncbi:tRNA dihydrouridine synthase [Lachnobacterium bovis]|uniref:tRNA-dihydrouridine synthase n=1 Tax=Lachnobacterium bovis TaxID=140626 RepID=A0A1H9P7N9_9FIRM|nr:tRNA-dihydrouridine synthase family protein [Lachnobacterium bovis]SER44256.1 tRNA-dihydrouridine synthase [Lachnobacterium bovis]